MAVPIAQLLIGALQSNSQNEQEKRAANAGRRESNIMQSRQNRQQATNTVLPERNPTGLEGIDVMSPATSRQMQIFNNFMNKSLPQFQQGGGMNA